MTTIEKVLKLIGDEKAKTRLSDIALDKAIGLNRSSIANWRLGRGTPSTEAILKIAKYFNVTTDYLLGLSNDPNPPQSTTKRSTFMTTVEKIQKLLNDNNISAYKLSLEIDVNKTFLTDWKSGKSKPSVDILTKIANYFHVSIDYLLGRTNNPDVFQLPANLIPEDVIIFPVIGTIAAGYDGNVSFNPTGDEIPVPKYLLKTHNPNDYFVLHVVGDSMLPTYHNGDKVLIRKTKSVDSGTIAAVGFDNENATLKKVEYVTGEDWMKLIPLNPDFPVKTITGADLEQCRVYGEVVYKFDNRTSAPDNDALTAQFNSLSAEQRKTILTLMNSMLEKK